MVRPRKNIDPEQVRKLAGWGLTQNDIASFVGWSQSLVSLRSSSFDQQFPLNLSCERKTICNMLFGN